MVLASCVQHLILVEEPQLQVLRTLTALLTLTVVAHGGDAALLLLEVSLRLLGIEDRRHEVGPVVAALEQSGIGGEEVIGRCLGAVARGRFNHQHPKHLTLRQRHRLQLLLHLLGSQQAQRMGLVAERIRKALGLRNVCI